MKPSAPVLEQKKVIAFVNNYVPMAVIQGFFESILQNMSLCKCYSIVQLLVSELQSSLPVRPATKAEQMRECLRSLKQNHKVNKILFLIIVY